MANNTEIRREVCQCLIAILTPTRTCLHSMAATNKQYIDIKIQKLKPRLFDVVHRDLLARGLSSQLLRYAACQPSDPEDDS